MSTLIPNFGVLEKLSTALNWHVLDFCKWVRPNSMICSCQTLKCFRHSKVCFLTALASEFWSVVIIAHFQGANNSMYLKCCQMKYKF